MARRQPPTKKAGVPSGARRIDGFVMDVTATAVWLGITPDTVRSRATAGSLPHRYWGSRLIFIREDLEKYFQTLPGMDAEQAVFNSRRRGQ